jgi:hypothetical protein
MCEWWLLAISLPALATSSTARAEPLENPHRDCNQQTLEEAIALERLGDREALSRPRAIVRLQADLPGRGVRPVRARAARGEERTMTALG